MGRARRRFWWVAMALLAGGCELFTGSSSGRDAGRDSGASGDWRLSGVEDRAYAPGEWLAVSLEGSDVDVSDVWLWWEPASASPLVLRMQPHRQGVDAVLPAYVEPVDAGDDGGGPGDAGVDASTDASASAGEYRFAQVVPVLEPGRYTFAIGTQTEPRTGTRTIEVVVPAPRMTREEAASVYADGLAGLAMEARALLDLEDPAWQEYLDVELGAERRASTLELLDSLGASRDGFEQLWLELPPEQEPAVQAFLMQSMIFGTLEAAALSSAAPPPSGIVPFDLRGRLSVYINNPIQAALFAADSASAWLGIASVAADVLTIIAAAGGPLVVPAGATATLVKVIAAIVKIMIDMMVPTDLDRVEGHGPRELVDLTAQDYVHWGVFAPQNRGVAVVRSFEDILLALLDEIVPGPEVRGLAPAIRTILATVAAHLPGGVVEAIGGWLSGAAPPSGLEMAIPIDMGLYDIHVSDLLSVTPLGTYYQSFTAFYDPRLVDSMEITGTSPSSALSDEPITWTHNGNWTRVRTQLDFGATGGAPSASAALVSSAFSFGVGGSAASFYQVPWPSFVTYSFPRTRIWQIPDIRDSNFGARVAPLIYRHVNLPSGARTEVVSRSTTLERAYQVRLGVVSDSATTTVVQILVNEEVQHPSVPLSLELTYLTLRFRPGARNTIRILALAGSSPACSTSSARLCITLHSGEATFGGSARYMFLNEGESVTIDAFTPPSPL